MGKRFFLFLVLLSLIAVLHSQPVSAQQYQIGKWTFNSSGATITNATYEMMNSVSEPVSGIMSNNQFIIQSGYRYSTAKDTVVTSIDPPEDLKTDQPERFALEQNYPNPFNPTTVIKYQVPVNSSVKLEVFDPLGKRVALLVNEQKNVGRYSVNFDASNLAGGIYLYRISAGEFVQTKKMLLVK